MASVPSGDGERCSRSGSAPARPTKDTGNGAAYWVLLIPLLGTLLPFIYNTRDPELIGIPFFYWYQMLWVPLSVVFTVIAYRATGGRRS